MRIASGTRWHCVAIGAILTAHILLVCYEARHVSATFDEPAHLASGLMHLTSGRFDYYTVNPPLVRLVAALPLWAIGLQMSGGDHARQSMRPEFHLGVLFMEDLSPDPQPVFVLARYACVLFSLVGALGCYMWASSFAGPRAGMVCLLLWCSEPCLSGYTCLATPDAATVSCGLLAAYSFYAWMTTPTFGRALVSGIGLGGAIATKFTWLILPPLWLILAAIACFRSFRCGQRVRTSLQLVTMMCVASYILQCAYSFNGCPCVLGDLRLYSDALRGVNAPGEGSVFTATCFAGMAVPVPSEVIRGIDLQQCDFESMPFDSYLGGQWQRGGWWYYYLYAASVKLSLAYIVLLGVSYAPIGEVLRQKALALCVLLLPPLIVLLTASLKTGFTHHFRYVLPIVAPILVLSSLWAGFGHKRGRTIVACGAVAWLVLSRGSGSPNGIGYFNERVAHGEGWRYLLHSNIDWGQGLVELRTWMRDHPDARPMRCAFYGYYDPTTYGIDAKPGPFGPTWSDSHDRRRFEPGWYAVSTNYVMGNSWRLAEPRAYEGLRVLEPKAVCNGSIMVFELTAPTAARLSGEGL
jgi:hypothetical protein